MLSEIIGIVALIIILSAILFKSEKAYRKDQAKKRRLANMRKAKVDREDRELDVRGKKRAEKFANENISEGNVG